MKTQTLTGKAKMKIALDPDGKVMDEVMVVVSEHSRKLHLLVLQQLSTLVT